MTLPMRACILSLILLLLGSLDGGFGLVAQAAPPAQTAPGTPTSPPGKPGPPEPVTAAKAGIVVEYPSGRILYAKNMRKRLPMASTTKTMTALLTLQRVAVTDIVTATANDLVGESTMGLFEGETQTVLNTLYGLMLPSGNDAAMVLARHVGSGLTEPPDAGPVQRFVALMNKQAALMGLADTNFMNPHGFDDPNHYSSAYDLASIAWYDLHNPTFNQIISQRFEDVPGHSLINTNELLTRYPGADGVKTGMTDEAGNCLVSSATRDGRRLIAVVLGEPYGHTYPDTIAMLDYGFAQPPTDTQERLVITQRATLLGYLASSLPTPLPTPRPTAVPPTATPRSLFSQLLPQAAAPGTDAAAVRAGTRPVAGPDNGGWLWSLLAVPVGVALLLLYRRRPNLSPPPPLLAGEGESDRSAATENGAGGDETTQNSELRNVPTAPLRDVLRTAEGDQNSNPQSAIRNPQSYMPAPAPRRPNLLGEDPSEGAARAVALAFRGQEGSSLAEFLAVVKADPEYSFAAIPRFYDMPAAGYLALARAYQQVDRSHYAAALLRLGRESYPDDRSLARLLAEVDLAATGEPEGVDLPKGA